MYTILYINITYTKDIVEIEIDRYVMHQVSFLGNMSLSSKKFAAEWLYWMPLKGAWPSLVSTLPSPTPKMRLHVRLAVEIRVRASSNELSNCIISLSRNVKGTYN